MGAATYARALKAGQKESKTYLSRNLDPYLNALENQLSPGAIVGEEDLGLMSIPMELIAGTRNTARRDCFSPTFLPLLEENSEFAAKWAALVEIHLAEGIRDPIKAVEYMNRYYVIEGHKRVSVLRYFDCPTVTATVVRLIPAPSDTLEYQIHQEYLSFYRKTKINYIQFSKPKMYGQLLNLMESGDNRPWDFERRREFFAYCTRFRRAYQELQEQIDMDRDEALLHYLKIYGYNHLREQTPSGLQRDLKAILAELNAGLEARDPDLSMDPEDSDLQASLFRRLIDPKPRVLKIAFLHDKSPEISWWTDSHERGRLYAQEQLGSQIESASFFNVLQEDPDELIHTLVGSGYRLIFTTTPRLLDVSLKAAAKYPNVKFLNCSLNTNHPILRTYYGRMYEAKFLTGAVAGACSSNGQIGYICNYPVYSSPASINAFALGARMVCPDAKIHLEWSTVPGANIFGRFREAGVDIVSGHDLHAPDQRRWAAGLFSLKKPTNGPLAISSWNWGQIYERIISGAMHGLWYMPGFVDQKGTAINYWWGLSSNAVQVQCSERIPASTRRLISILEQQIIKQNLSVFTGPIYDQEGVLRVKENEVMSQIQIVQMDWLVDNVLGSIPRLEDMNPDARALTEISGVLKTEE